MSKIRKGEYGYISYEKKKRFAVAALSLALPVVVFAVARYYSGTTKNIFSVVSVLGLLPASQNILACIMMMLQKKAPKAVVDMVRREGSTLLSAYELVVTAYEGRMPLDAVVIRDHDVAACSTMGDKAQFAFMEKHIAKILADGGHGSVNVHIFGDLKSFQERVISLSRREETEKMRSHEEAILKTLKAVSL